MRKGNIVLLNGVSSSGKTTISQELIKRLPNYFYFSADDYDCLIEKMEDRKNGRLIPVETEIFIHRTIQMFSDLGVNLIVDYVIHNESTLMDFRRTVANVPIILIGIHCPTEILDRRERERGDRVVGLANSQLDFVHKGIKYDLEINTHNNTLEYNINIICNHIRSLTTTT